MFFVEMADFAKQNPPFNTRLLFDTEQTGGIKRLNSLSRLIPPVCLPVDKSICVVGKSVIELLPGGKEWEIILC